MLDGVSGIPVDDSPEIFIANGNMADTVAYLDSNRFNSNVNLTFLVTVSTIS